MTEELWAFSPSSLKWLLSAKAMLQQFWHNMQDLMVSTMFHSYLLSVHSLFSFTDLFLFAKCEDNTANFYFK